MRMRVPAGGGVVEGEPLAPTSSLRDAVSVFVLRSVDRLPVVDAQGAVLGEIHLADLVQRPEGQRPA